MLIHGTKRVERRVGYVADFCPVCRSPRAFRLLRIGIAEHLYMVSFGEGKLVGHMRECLSCSVRTTTDPLQYASTEKSPNAKVDEMVQRTLPNMQTLYAARLAREDEIRENPHSLAPNVRMDFISEPFRLLNSVVEERFESSTQLDKQSGIGCLGTVLIPVVILLAVQYFGRADRVNWDMAWIVAAGAGVLAFLYTLVQLHFAPRRYVRQKVIPVLAKALRPLEPTKEELASCLSRCKTASMKIGRHVKLDALITELADTAQRFN